MPFLSNVVGLLFLLLTISSALANYFTDSGLVAVTSYDQLWRFQVGPSEIDHGVTPGDDYICLRDSWGKYIRETSDGPRRTATDCREDERFLVYFKDGFALIRASKDGFYIQCKEDHAESDSFSEAPTHFLLYIDYAEERQLSLYNPIFRRELEAIYDDHQLACSNDRTYPSGSFSGWKTGSKDDWRATDEWVVVGTFDNRLSKSTATFTYSRTVGVEQLPSIRTGAGVAVPVEVGITFGEFFSSKVSSTAGVDWSRESPATWSARTTTTEDSIEVPPGVATAVSQAVGTYGIFIVKSNYFRSEDFDSEGNALNQRLVTVVT